MCGIAGWVEWGRDMTAEQRVLEAMGAELAYRGPDDSGIWASGPVGLSHRRLVVVDPAGGGQPMVRYRGDTAYTLVYNGELYNTEELRRELQVKGYTFRGHSDTEVLLLSYMEWGPECVEKFNGIFAFGVWSGADQSLFLARDRLGVKPLFYVHRSGSLLFGSELKALLAHPSVKPQLDEEGLAEVFVMGPDRTPGHGVFRGVDSLRPGHWILFDRQGLHLHQYWKVEARPHTDDLPTTIEHVRELLCDAAQRQLVSDVPLCTLLSGGLDSSTITAFAALKYQEEGRPPLHTYSVDYVGNGEYFHPNRFQPNSDAQFIDLVTDRYGTQHHSVLIDTPELAQALVRATTARDLPGMADVDSSLYLFCREIKKTHTVALSGEAADEIFGGYPWFQDADALAHDTYPWARFPELRARVLAPDLARRLKPREYLADNFHQELARVPTLPGEDPEAQRMRRLSYLNISRFMKVLLDRKDRMSMAVGLEVRVPYCDHRLVEYVWNVPWALKEVDGMEKGLLRRAVADLLPPAIVERKKSPYPKTHNPDYLQAVRELLREVLDDTTSPLRDLVNIEEVRRIAATADSINLPFFGQLMTGPQLLAYLVQVDVWLRHYRVSVKL